jgi:hypothetical protein
MVDDTWLNYYKDLLTYSNELNKTNPKFQVQETKQIPSLWIL